MSQRVRFGETPRVRFRYGVMTSFVVHVIFAAVVVFVLERTAADAGGVNQVFSVTLEGGMSLGGVSQVPKPNAKKILTPEQNQEDEKAPEKKEPEEKSKEPETKKAPPEEKIEEKKPEKQLTEPSVVEDPAKLLAEKKAREEKEKKIEEQKRREEKEKKEKKLKEDEKRREEKEKKDRERERAERNKLLDQALKRVQNQYEGESADAGGKGFGAAALGGKGMGGGTLASIERIAYENELKKHVKKGWHWMGGTAQLKASIRVKILPNGQIQEARIEASSGNRNFDDSVIRAVNEASPVPPPPPSLYEDYKNPVFTFDSKEGEL